MWVLLEYSSFDQFPKIYVLHDFENKGFSQAYVVDYWAEQKDLLNIDLKSQDMSHDNNFFLA